SILQSLFKLSAAGLVGAVIMQSLKHVLVAFFPLQTFMNVFLQGLFSGGIGLLAYFAIAWMLKSEEMHAFVSSMQKRVLRKAKVDATQTLG
ncbi:hypothetical protein HY771_02805, partial [Candidatus Uhrbacteria bacterium]|nr:hypothetical protein [Candidatus Uhrbacteria bacterium]